MLLAHTISEGFDISGPGLLRAKPESDGEEFLVL